MGERGSPGSSEWQQVRHDEVVAGETRRGEHLQEGGRSTEMHLQYTQWSP